MGSLQQREQLLYHVEKKYISTFAEEWKCLKVFSIASKLLNIFRKKHLISSPVMLQISYLQRTRQQYDSNNGLNSLRGRKLSAYIGWMKISEVTDGILSWYLNHKICILYTIAQISFLKKKNPLFIKMLSHWNFILVIL